MSLHATRSLLSHLLTRYRTGSFPLLSTRQYSSSDDDTDDPLITRPFIMYTDGMQSDSTQNMGIGIFIEDDHPLNLCVPVRHKTSSPARTPELQAVRLALWRLHKWPKYMEENVIIRTRFDPFVYAFYNWKNGEASDRSFSDMMRQMDRFPSVRIEPADADDGYLTMASCLAATALDELEMERPREQHLRLARAFPLLLSSGNPEESPRLE